MRGEVSIYHGDKFAYKESNMLVDQAGSLFVDILTANPSLSGIESASAILDASNYTIQAISFGGGYQDYQNHAFGIDVSAQAITSASIVVNSHVDSSAGDWANSYHGQLKDLAPISYSQPKDTRIERRPTIPPLVDPALNNYDNALSGMDFDKGQFLNTLHTSASNGLGVSSLLVGAYPASGGTWYRLLNHDDTFASGGRFYSKYNEDHVMDASGFINMTVSSGQQGQEIEAAATSVNTQYSGLIIWAPADGSFSGANGHLSYRTFVSGGDAGALALYGGIYGAGLWYLDLKTLLAEGQLPPYSFDSLNNVRKYKLFAKKTFTRSPTYHADSEAGDSPHPIGGLRSFEHAPELDGTFPHSLVNFIGVTWTIYL